MKAMKNSMINKGNSSIPLFKTRKSMDRFNAQIKRKTLKQSTTMKTKE